MLQMSLESLTDNDLLDLLTEGNEEAFTEIFNRYWKPVLTVAANKTGDLDEAEDIVQDLFISLWKRRADLQLTSSLGSYLAVSAKYKVLKVLAARNKTLSLEEGSQAAALSSPSGAESAMEMEQLTGRLSEVVESLPEKCRIVYRLSRESGFSHKEIAGQMAISEKTVEAHISRALRAIRHAIVHSLCFFFL